MDIKKLNLQRQIAERRCRTAVEEHRKTLQMEPDNVCARVALVRNLLFLEDNSQAIAECKIGLRYNPDSALLYRLLGYTHLRLSNHETAEAILRRSITLDPKCTETYVLLGIALTKIDQIEEAVTHLQHALKLDPQNNMAYLNLAIAYAQLEEFLLAHQAMTQSIRLRPTPRKIWNNWVYWIKSRSRRTQELIAYGLLTLLLCVLIQHPLLFAFVAPFMLIDTVMDLRQGKTARGLGKLIITGALGLSLLVIYFSE